MTDDFVVVAGGAVKALGRDKLAGYIVRYGDASDTDGHHEFFHPDTTFDLEDRVALPTFWFHGQAKTWGRRKLARAIPQRDSVGVFVEAKLSPWDEVAERVAHLAAQNKLSWSSGSVAHLVMKKDLGGGVKKILYWPLVECSVLPTSEAAESRNVVSLKSLMHSRDYEQESVNLQAEFERLHFLQITRECRPSLDGADREEMQRIYAAMALQRLGIV